MLSNTDREVLVLLSQLALSTHVEHTNVGSDEVPLSPFEADRLLVLLEEFIVSRRFVEGSYFSEGIANGQGYSSDRLKEIYLSWRTRTGRTRVASTYTWSEFVLRAGFNSSANAWMWPRSGLSPVRPMSLTHFVAMEQKLANAVGLHPRVRDLIVEFVESGLAQLQDLREGKATIKEGFVRRFVRSFIDALSDAKVGREKFPMTRRKVIAVSTIFMDTAALFVTRDWTATGVLSTVAAVVPDALDYVPPR